MITLYASNFHPSFAHGAVRDIRARWALEEAGLPYETQMVGQKGLTTPEYRAIHPFGNIPAILDEDGLVIFESANAATFCCRATVLKRCAQPHGSAPRQRRWSGLWPRLDGSTFS